MRQDRTPVETSTAALRSPATRMPGLDLARTAALAGMILYHFVYDLDFFGLLPRGTIWSGLWPLLARSVAASFLFLSGVSLYLAHRHGIRWRAFLTRLAKIASAAALVTVATWIVAPTHFIFFGILHAIAFASVVGLLFLRLPAVVTLLAAGAILVAPLYLAGAAFNQSGLLWLGLFTRHPATMDFEPVFPWLAAALAGIATAQLAEVVGFLRLATPSQAPGRLIRCLTWPGQHSLTIYLVHQPVLIGLVWLMAHVIS